MGSAERSGPRLLMRGHGTYLDANVLLDMAESLSGRWHPPPGALDNTDRQYMAAARVWFYGYEPRSSWFLTTSRLGRTEAIERAGWDWITGFVDQVDSHSDAPTVTAVEDLAQRFAEEVGLGLADATHLAQVDLRPWMGRLVTSDKKFRKKARSATLAHPVEFLSVIEAELALGIRPGEEPPIRPHPSSPLANMEPWWIPPEMSIPFQSSESQSCL
jgi:predicted nucleic acid-binding protein